MTTLRSESEYASSFNVLLDFIDREISSKDDEAMPVDLDGKTIPVYGSLLYLSTFFWDESYTAIINALYNQCSVEYLRNNIKSHEENTFRANPKQYKSSRYKNRIPLYATTTFTGDSSSILGETDYELIAAVVSNYDKLNMVREYSDAFMTLDSFREAILSAAVNAIGLFSRSLPDMPTIFNIHSGILYHYIANKLNRKDYKRIMEYIYGKKEYPDVTEITLTEFIDNTFGKPAIQYIKDFNDHGYNDALIINLSELCGAMEAYRYIKSDNDELADLWEKAIKDLDSTAFSETEIFDCAVDFNMLMTLPGSYLNCIGSCSSEACAYALIVTNKMEMDKQTKAQISKRINNQYRHTIHDTLYITYAALGLHFRKQLIEMDKLIKSDEKLRASVDDFQKKYKDTKAKLKETNSKLTEITRALESEKAKVSKLSKSTISVDDFENTKLELEKVNEKLDKAYEESAALTRQYNRKCDECASLEEELEIEKQAHSDIRDKLDRNTSLIGEMECSRAFNNIPMECFVNAIKNFNIVLIGGNMMFEKLAIYGLDNIRTYKAGYRGITLNDIAKADLVIIATAYGRESF